MRYLSNRKFNSVTTAYIIRSRSIMASRAITRQYRRAALYSPGDKTVGIMDTGKIMAAQAEIFTGNTVKVMWGILGVIEARILFLDSNYQLF